MKSNGLTEGLEATDKTGISESSALSRRDRRRMETRERLFEVAMELLTEHNFDAVTVEMITEAADVGKGTFFNYFENKEAVVGYMFEKQLALLKKRFQGIVTDKTEASDAASAPVSPEAPIWQRMIAIALEAAELDGRSKRLTRTLLALGLTNPAVRTVCLNLHREVIELSHELIRAGQAQGELRSDISPEILSCYMGDIYVQALFAWSQSDEDNTLREVMERSYLLATEGIRPR